MIKQDLQHAFPIVAMQLAGNLDVEMIMGGNQAWTDGKTICLPTIDFDNERAADMGFGFTSHEAAHIRFTTIWKPSGNAFKDFLVNCLEDLRIEYKLPHMFPGTRERLLAMNTYLAEDAVANLTNFGDDPHPASVVTSYVLARGLLENGVEAYATVIDTLKSLIKKLFREGTPVKLNALISSVHQCDDTKGVVIIAEKIIDMLEEETPEKDNSDDDNSDGESSDSQDDTTASNGDDNSSDSDGSDGDDSQDNGDDANDSDSDSDSDDATNTTFNRMMETHDDDLPDDKMDAVAKELGDASDENGGDKDDNYIASEPTNTSFINNEKLSQKRYEEALELSTGLKAQLRALVESKSNQTPYAKRTGSKIDSSLMHRIATGDSRVFLHKSQKTTTETAVHVLLDKSTSMKGDFINSAVIAAATLELAMNGIRGINSALTAFPAGNDDLVCPISRHNQVSTSEIPLGIDGSGCTPMTQAMWYSANELLKQKEGRKMLIVITDGIPDDENSVKNFIKLATNSGVEVIGIGIQADYVKKMFPVAAVIDEPSDLRSALVSLITPRLAAA